MRAVHRVIPVVVGVVVLGVLSGCPFFLGPPEAGDTRTFDGIEFQWCPPGTFLMGSPPDEVGHTNDETLHAVTISEGFWLSKYEVTQAQWEAVMGANPSNYPGADNPVDSVTWEDVRLFLLYLNYAKATALYRLPTEAEWEYACRAGESARFYWGDDPNATEIDNYAWHSSNSGGVPHPVGEKLPNDWGLYDMSGNLWEWCQDWYGGDYYEASSVEPVTNPLGPDSGVNRIVRGAAFESPPFLNLHRSAARASYLPGSSNFFGFRVLRTAE